MPPVQQMDVLRYPSSFELMVKSAGKKDLHFLERHEREQNRHPISDFPHHHTEPGSFAKSKPEFEHEHRKRDQSGLKVKMRTIGKERRQQSDVSKISNQYPFGSSE